MVSQRKTFFVQARGKVFPVTPVFEANFVDDQDGTENCIPEVLIPSLVDFSSDIITVLPSLLEISPVSGEVFPVLPDSFLPSSSSVSNFSEVLQDPEENEIEISNPNSAGIPTFSNQVTFAPEVEEISYIPKMLDLFCGTGSVGRVFAALGYQVVSVDMDPRYNADFQVNVLDWDFEATFDRGQFDVVFCCPPCTEYSQALTTRERDLPKADLVVTKALEIIQYLAPPVWFLENPKRGLLSQSSIYEGNSLRRC